MSIFDNTLMRDIIDYLSNEGIELIIQTDINANVVVDVQTMAKSELKLGVNDEGQVVAMMRYDEVVYIETTDDVLHAVKACLHNRDYMSSYWVDLLQREDILGEVW